MIKSAKRSENESMAPLLGVWKGVCGGAEKGVLY